MTDSETLVEIDEPDKEVSSRFSSFAESGQDDFPSMCVDLFRKANFKIGIFMYIIGIFIFSDMFIDKVLSKFKDSVTDDHQSTTKGTAIQLIFFVLAYICLDLLVQNKYI